ncbi:unnamed protein product [Symbiodinium microadriaticum]|nr:unnamed protein product [Symbiodinium microadriaticum]CAE7948917.1 unnamed protein product [Symbiodinium sp. KB8]
MALARQLRRSLAGLGAYSLCLLGILLGPSGHLGGMFGPFIAVVSITLICASGVYVVHIMSKTFSSQESAGQHVVLAFVWLIVLAVMLAVGMGPTQVAVELNLVSDLHGVSVCNWSDWSDTGGGVFFRDGSTLLGDSREELPISHVTVDKCDFQGFRWRDCSLFVEPILRCSGPEQRCKQVCAWAVSTTGIRAAFNGCGRQNGRRAICGIAVSMTRLTAGRCAGPVAQADVENCEEVTQKLAAQLDDIAENMSLSTSWERWDGAARPAPLLLMEDPRMIRTVLDFYIWTFAVLGFIYLPFPLLIVLCYQSLTSCAGPAWDLLCPWRRSSANNGQNYVALDQS